MALRISISVNDFQPHSRVVCTCFPPPRCLQLIILSSMGPPVLSLPFLEFLIFFSHP